MAHDQRANTQYEELSERVDKFTEALPVEERKFKVSEESFAEEMQSFESQVAEYLVKSKHVSVIQYIAHHRVFSGLKKRESLASNQLKQTDERCFALKLELCKISKHREQTSSRIVAELEDLLSKISVQVDKERIVRQNAFSQIAEKLQSETQRVQQMVNLEHEVRNDTQGSLQGLLEELESNMNKVLGKETESRIHNEMTFMETLELTCKQIEHDL